MTKITTVTSSQNSLFSNTGLIEAPQGVIVIDPPMLLPDVCAVADAVKSTGSPLAGVIYTHPHPDTRASVTARE